jgi:ribonuclease HII
LESLRGKYALAVVDGFDLNRPDLRARSVVGADYKSAVVAAASIVAKVARDRLMRALAPTHPEYGFDEHVGYATEQHRDALRRHGPCGLHRLSFHGVEGLQLGLWDE